jgi:hypothetical protein
MGAKVNKEKMQEAGNLAANVAREALRVVAKEVAEKLVGESPIWSGSYLASHRVAVSEKTPVITEGPTNLQKWSVPGQKYPDQLTDMEAVALQEKVQMNLNQQIDMGIDALPTGIGVVKFENNSDHADEVERGSGQTPAYMVYEAVLNHVRTFIKTITMNVSQRVGLKMSFKTKGGSK